jgi:hypothetical protein
MNIMWCASEEFPNCCGVQEVGGFASEPVYCKRYIKKITPSGTGVFLSTFIDDYFCKKAYLSLIKNHILLYQSPLYYNKESGNHLFLCVFLHKDKS